MMFKKFDDAPVQCGVIHTRDCGVWPATFSGVLRELRWAPRAVCGPVREGIDSCVPGHGCVAVNVAWRRSLG